MCVKSTPPLIDLQNQGFRRLSLPGAFTETLQTTTTITTGAPAQARRGGRFHRLTWTRRKPTDRSVHCAWVKVGLGSQSLVCNSLLQHRRPHFKVFCFWPLIMISRTWERSIILVSISMMSGCSLAPLMNSSSVNSPDDTKQKKKKHIKIEPATTKPTAGEGSGQKRVSLPSPLTSILS